MNQRQSRKTLTECTNIIEILIYISLVASNNFLDYIFMTVGHAISLSHVLDPFRISQVSLTNVNKQTFTDIILLSSTSFIGDIPVAPTVAVYLITVADLNKKRPVLAENVKTLVNNYQKLGLYKSLIFAPSPQLPNSPTSQRLCS